MRDNLVAHKPSLIERLENESDAIGNNNPFYWYLHLESLGKRAQTKEVVEDAVNGFNVDNHAYTILKVIAKKHLSREVCEIAVRKNGLNLKYAPEQYRDVSMCMSAAQSDGGALRDVPIQILLGDKGYEICLAAVCNDFEGRALSFVPNCYLRGKEGKALCEAAVRKNGYALKYVPKRLITKELIALSARLHPESLRYAPSEFVSRDLCLELVERNPMSLRYVPMPDKKLVDSALQANPRVVLEIPESMLTLKRCRDALRRDPTIPIEKLPESYRKKLEKEFQPDAFVKYEPIALETPFVTDEGKQAISRLDEPHVYDLSVANSSMETIYYISDIHLEHQLVKQPDDIVKLSLPEIQERIDNKIAELFASAPDFQGTLLIGGDVADGVELEALFYKRLVSFFSSRGWWQSNIFAVLGNHELWDGDPMGLKPARPIDEIIADYRQAMPLRVKLLENELFIVYKGFNKSVLDENAILNASVEELAEACADSTFLLLGGIGFSGLNPVYNAETGLYRTAVSTEEDIVRSKRFRAIYEKVLASAEDVPIIVLTHTKMTDWSDAQYNPKWIYVNGHTHQNTLLLQEDGTSVFSDNQIGYKPKPWHLNGFTVDVHRYDPFKYYPDGIRQITREQYIEFNRGYGIKMQSMKHPGNLYMLKHDGVYMFVLESGSSLCLLEGGRLHKLNHGIGYYCENLPEYVRRVRSAFMPYKKALSMLSDEVVAIGGSGSIHGCIVDIDWFNHIYLNPFDGKVTPYFAWNKTEKMMFENVELLLSSSPLPPRLSDGESMLARYLSTPSREKRLPILSRASSKEWELTVVPQVVLDRSMYEPSRIMRSIQYLFDQNVLRIWNDTILAVNDDDDLRALPGKRKLLGSQFLQP